MSTYDDKLETLERVVLEKCQAFVRLSIWPRSEKLDYNRWLKNFEGSRDKIFALHLLDGFTFYSHELCLAMMRSSILSLSTTIPGQTVDEKLRNWGNFLGDCLFVPMEGESKTPIEEDLDPDITGSGITSAASIRKEFGIDQTQLKTVRYIVMAEKLSHRHLIFFDDFVGSGEQFDKLMKRPALGKTFHEVLVDKGLNLAYCCMVATDVGLDRLQRDYPNVKITPCHIVAKDQSAGDKRSSIWPDELRDEVDDFIVRKSLEAGIAASDIYGFNNLGLALAFEGTIPDATLPLFYHRGPNWEPLMERR